MKKVIVGTLVCLAVVWSVWSAIRTGVHDFSEDRCGDCHAAAPVKGDPRTKIMKAPVSTLCARCHDRAADSLSHPVEMTPANADLPPDLPLSWDGKITCSTCHDIHAAPPLLDEGPWHFLRRSAGGRAFCEACHRAGVVEAGNRADHSLWMETAHMRSDGEKGGRIDNLSAYCLGCHDGTIGRIIDVRFASSRRELVAADSTPEQSHPVGVKYRAEMMRRSGLRPQEMLDPKIRLVDGKISCVSCHDPYAKNAKLLTAAPASLCPGCHNK